MKTTTEDLEPKPPAGPMEYHPGCVLAALDHDDMAICSRCWSLGASRGGTANGPDVIAQIAGLAAARPEGDAR